MVMLINLKEIRLTPQTINFIMEAMEENQHLNIKNITDVAL
jgi:hypothetical protein